MTAGKDLSLTVAKGEVRLDTAASLSAGTALVLGMGVGNLSMASGASMAGRTLLLDIAAGNLSTEGDVTITATDVADLRVTGDVRLAGRTSVLVGNVLSGLHSSGTVTLSGDTVIHIGRSGALAVVGDLRLSDRASVVVGDGEGVLLANVVGNVALSGQSQLSVAGGDLAVDVVRGSVAMADQSAVIAGRFVLDIARGALTMADADTRIIASDRVAVTAEGDIRLDRITATKAVTLTSRSGAILDNTAAEEELIVTGTLSMVARDGVGQTASNLNVSAAVLNASAERSGGINISMRNGFKVGDKGVVNRGSGDILLFSEGRILYNRIGFQADRRGDFPMQVINGPRQGIHVINGGAPGFQVGLSTIPVVAMAYLADPERIPTEIAAAALAGRSVPETSATEKAETPSALSKVIQLASRPIRIAAEPVETGAGSILQALGLGEAARPIIPEIAALRHELGRFEPAGRTGGRPVDLEAMLDALAAGPAASAQDQDILPASDLRRSLDSILEAIAAMEVPATGGPAGTPANDPVPEVHGGGTRDREARLDDLDAPLVPADPRRTANAWKPEVETFLPAAE